MPDSGNRAGEAREEAVWVCMTPPCGSGVEWCVAVILEKGSLCF